MMTKTMAGKIALVTGGASGIGRAAARAFAEHGARIVVADMDEAGGSETVRIIEAEGGFAAFVRVDVTRPAEVESLIEGIVHVHGRLDCAHNNAGVLGMLAKTADCTEENWERVISTNIKGTWLCMKHEIRQMLRQGSGTIVNTSSIWGLVGTGMGVSAYVASKHAIAGLTRAAALEYATSGIRINAVCPGAVRTPLFERVVASQPEIAQHAIAAMPIGRVGDPQEIATAVVWLCSDAATFVHGATMSVDGGMYAT